MFDATERLSEFAAGLTYEDLSAEVIETTKMFILDYYATCYAGHKVNETFNRAMLKIIGDMGGRSEATALFYARKLPAEHAAFLNAVYAHGADMDDGNRKAMGHVAAHVMSAVFALAETLEEIRWRDVFVAINVGYEIYNRVAAAAQPGLVRRGFHSTGTAGAIACGAACAKLMGMDAKGIYNTMAIAAIQASGLIIIAESGQSCKPINPANAAKTGILSAKLTACGVEGPIHPLESGKGWFHAMTDQVSEEAIVEGLGQVFTICESYLKPYPSCRHTHCGIEGALRIREQVIEQYGALDPDAVAGVDVYIYRNAIQIAGQIEIPVTADDMKFSIHYSLALALLQGGFGLDDLSLDRIDDTVRGMIGKIRLIEDSTMEDTKAGIRGARVTVRMQGGAQYTAQVLIPKGDAANPFSWTDMETKLADCTAGLLSDRQRSLLEEHIRSISMEERFGSVKPSFLESNL